MVILNSDSSVVHLRGTRSLQAGELIVPRNELLTPSRLKALSNAGWSVVSSRPVKAGGFALLLQREMSDLDMPNDEDVEDDEEPPRHTNVVHKGGIRCPHYCNCVSEAVVEAMMKEIGL